MQRDSDMLIVVSHVHLHFVKRSISESIAVVLNIFSITPPESNFPLAHASFTQ